MVFILTSLIGICLLLAWIRQGAGYGTELMKHALQRCDADRKLAYLESSNPRNTPFYERLGFERLGAIQAGTFPQIVPMLRKPR